jgi:excisionase family DNA binding protein
MNETNLQTQRLRVSPAEFARMIGLSKWMVYRLIWDGHIPHTKLGNYRSRKARILIDPTAALAELERRYGRPVRRQF